MVLEDDEHKRLRRVEAEAKKTHKEILMDGVANHETRINAKKTKKK
jgi:hypothetical protein